MLTLSGPLTTEFSALRPDIQALQADLVTWRRQIHQRPELGFQEDLTARFICERLTEWGIAHKSGIARTGVVAILEGKQGTSTMPNSHHNTGGVSKPVLGIRADMDGLPVQELNEVPYCSIHDGKMHACGHDGHVAIALGTAKYLKDHPETFSGTVKLIFQPAEEGPGGAKPMVEASVLKDPDVDALVGLHLWNNLPLGTLGIRSGPMMAATEFFHCTIQGRGGHGAIPQQTIDAVVVGSQVVTALQTLVARNIDPLKSAVVSVGEFKAGTAVNVIADSAFLSGTVRYFDPDYGELIPQRLEQIIAGVCAAHGASYTLDYHKLYPPVINDEAVTDLVRSVAFSVVETPAGVVPECQTMGGEDVSFFLQAVPGCYFFLGAANVNKNLAYPHHHPRFDFDETALGVGVETFVRIVEKFCPPTSYPARSLSS
ncbi:amidohydrolase subfamily [Synechococcus sp. PCC 7335]|uniref:M20 metallopeptidase family protein n=1 Tax=Synechococcus sp. (strain ATCC 29403 / PCC 7335) TaxID=91464 RepID=UPI00017EB842|nr:amidohydrolase [Synechococcus sp. PCC 7335]EDX84166.1 amidohydrolase subfamily [Synechococcus sp. PCC 7335]